MKTAEGLFITFEGCEGAGKSTLMLRVFDALVKKGFDVIKTREPGGSLIGQQLRKLLLESETLSPRTEVLLFLADRAEHVHSVILPALEANKIVLCDRYTDSTLAYQGAARELDISQLCSFAAHDLEPHLTIYLDIDPHLGFSRIHRKKDRMESEGNQFHEKVREGFLHLAKQHEDRIVSLDASRSPEAVFKLTMEAVNGKLGRTICPM
ncbi:MAG: dTMP kinase [Simkaniaceae bacterium]|nr:dTMP kinase [Simkaniaceae bacterium]